MFNKTTKKLAALAWTEWRLRHQSTFLGFLWTMLNPALMFSVLYVVFVKWMGNKQEDYSLFLIVGIVQWNFFSSGTSYTLSSLIRRSSLMRNFPIRAELPVLAAIISGYFSHLLELAALLLLLVIFGHGAHLSWVWVIPLDLACLVLSAGIGMVLAGLAVFYMDLDRIWGILLTAGFFLTPIFYPLSVVEHSRRRLLELNPMTAILENMRLAITGGFPTPGSMLYTAVCALAALAVGLAFLRLCHTRIMDSL